MKLSRKIIYSLLAGVAISIGAIIYLLCSNKIVGALLFSVGIIMVMEFMFLLFTGYVPTQRDKQPIKEYIVNSLFVLVGNIVGVLITVGLIALTRDKNSLYEAALKISETKLNDNLLSIFILSIFCGFIIAMIVKANNYKKQIIYSAMMIAVFILSSFEHVVANAFYLGISGKLFTWQGLLFMLICALGNFVGGFASSFIESQSQEIKVEENKNVS